MAVVVVSRRSGPQRATFRQTMPRFASVFAVRSRHDPQYLGCKCLRSPRSPTAARGGPLSCEFSRGHQKDRRPWQSRQWWRLHQTLPILAEDDAYPVRRTPLWAARCSFMFLLRDVCWTVGQGRMAVLADPRWSGKVPLSATTTAPSTPLRMSVRSRSRSGDWSRSSGCGRGSS